jgi:hypothetical protein
MRKSFLTFALVAAVFALTACSSNKDEGDPFQDMSAAERFEDYVPPTAQIVAEGTGPLRYAPETGGTLYLLDLDDMRRVKETTKPHVIMTGTPAPGPEIVFDPQTKTVSRAGKTAVKLTKVTAGHRHQLRWQPAKQDKSGQTPPQ